VTFEILLEEIDSVIEKVNQSGSRAFANGELDAACQILSQAQALTDFKPEVASLRERWGGLYAVQDEQVKAVASKRNRGRLKKGLRTRESAYYAPILRVLADMGGGGEVGEVLDRVYAIMKDSLKPVDEEPLPSPAQNAALAQCRLLGAGLHGKGRTAQS